MHRCSSVDANFGGIFHTTSVCVCVRAYVDRRVTASPCCLLRFVGEEGTRVASSIERCEKMEKTLLNLRR